ncbi:hypothetical protein N9V96_03865 [Polaribacter sp.]|nr:hypothetical protein [Polaribacter sp.]
MKSTQKILLFCITLLLLNCSEKEDMPTILFSKDIVIGTFDIQNIDEEIEATVITSDIEVEVSNTKSTADTFEVSFILNNDNSYTASGKYRKISTVSPTGQSSTTSATIIVFSDSGTFSVDENENTITFFATTQEFLNGTYLVADFEEDSFTLQKETVTVDAQITSTSNLEITFSEIVE